jgi:branched-chain amino acid transport system substrate-binding protein
MTTSKRALHALGAVALASLLVGNAAPRVAQASVSHANATVTIGVSVPILQLAELANGIARGVKVAVAQANATNLVPGVTFKANVLDDTINNSNNPEKDAANARTFIADSTVIGEVGPLNSGATKGSEAVYNQAGLVQISPSNTNVDLTDPKLRGKYEPRTASGKGPITYFRTVTTDLHQGSDDAAYAVKVLKAKRIAITDNTDPYGVGLAASFKAEALKLGATIVGSGELDVSLPKLGSDQVARNIASASGGKVDLVFFGGEYDSHTGGGTFLADALKAAGLNCYFMGGDGLYAQDFITASSNGGVLKSYASSIGPDALNFPAAKTFLALEAKQFPGIPTAAYDVESFDAANVILQAYAKAVKAGKIKVGQAQNVTTRSIIAANVGATKHWPGGSGDVSFDANGDLTSFVVSMYKVVGSGKTAHWVYAGVAPQP